MIRAANLPFPIYNIRLNNGCNIAYLDEGKSETTILFIHGLALYGLSWRKNINQLKENFRCIALDLPGNGFSDRDNYSYSIPFFADCVSELIEKLDLKNVVLTGHSMGGQIALYLCIHKPYIATKLVLCAPAGFETFTYMEKTMYKSAIGFFDLFSTEENSLRQSVYSSFYNRPSQGDEMINELTDIMKAYPLRVYRQMIDACVSGMLNEPVYDRIQEIKQPTLILYGEQDALIPNRLLHPITTKQVAQQAAKKIKNSTLHIIPRCGHFLQIEKAPEVNDYINGFIKS